MFNCSKNVFSIFLCHTVLMRYLVLYGLLEHLKLCNSVQKFIYFPFIEQTLDIHFRIEIFIKFFRTKVNYLFGIIQVIKLFIYPLSLKKSQSKTLINIYNTDSLIVTYILASTPVNSTPIYLVFDLLLPHYIRVSVSSLQELLELGLPTHCVKRVVEMGVDRKGVILRLCDTQFKVLSKRVILM